MLLSLPLLYSAKSSVHGMKSYKLLASYNPENFLFSRNILKFGELLNPAGTTILWNLGFVSRMHLGKNSRKTFGKGTYFVNFTLRGYSLFERPPVVSCCGSLCKLVMFITSGRKYWAPPIVSSLSMYSGFQGQLRRKIFVHQYKGRWSYSSCCR